MKVLAFEDSFDLAALLTEAGVDMSDIEFRQHWNTMDALDRIKEFEPDVLLLDHWIPPTKGRSEEHTSELQSRTISYAVFCLKKKKKKHSTPQPDDTT